MTWFDRLRRLPDIPDTLAPLLASLTDDQLANVAGLSGETKVVFDVPPGSTITVGKHLVKAEIRRRAIR